MLGDFVMTKEEAKWFEKQFGVKVEDVFDIDRTRRGITTYSGGGDLYAYKSSVPFEFKKRVWSYFNLNDAPYFDRDIGDQYVIGFKTGVIHRTSPPEE